ncbi:UNVERIFIED_CONTAM: hypothetical protein GTU68_045088 [Idotea baltica]|nr:hypothetical protein [Idotea baltica]
MEKKTIIDKIWDRHVVTTQEGHPSVFAIDLMLIHEVTSAQAFQALRDRKLTISDRSRFLATLDHSIPTRQNRFEIYDTAAKNQVDTLRRNCVEFEIPLCDFESGHQGVVHVIGPELGLTQPGMTICCGDSHTSTHGAFGALAFGVGTSEVSHVLTTGCLLQLSKLEPMVTWGTNPGQACGISEKIPVAADLPAKEHGTLKESLEYIALDEGAAIADTPVDWAFIGSCTNGRIEDLREAAEVMKGHSVHESVTMYVVPGSEAVRAQAINEGLDKVFIDAGADFRMPGCSMCLAMNDDKVPEGMRCISSSNRNFIGRQGPGSRTHLASPATVAASAIAGKIVTPTKYL